MKKTIFLLLSFQVAMLAQISSDRMARAFNAYKNSDFGTAYLMFKNIVSNDNLAEEKLAMAKYYEADCLLNLNQLDGAAEAFESFIDKFRFSNLREYALYKLGTIYYTKTDYRRCRDRLQILFAEYPNSQFAGSAYYWMSEAYFAENKFLEAEENFKNAIGQKETNKYLVNTYYSLGQLYEKTADYTNAVKYYDELLAYYKDSPLAPESQMRIGVCYFNLKQYDNAILELSDPLIRKLPEERLFEAKVFLANSFIRLQEYSDAARVYNELLPQVHGENYKNRINYNLAWIDFQLNDYNAAYKKFKILADSTSDSLKVASLYWSGECKRYLGDSKAANEIFSEFVAKYPSSPLASRAQLGMGSVMYKQ
ncbi:MAG: tetratricopeptide repeat protein, partial [Bacteroidetes bacterium]|nr:tetratricopeptide repeat protein [Bacteroidota bacterium]